MAEVLKSLIISIPSLIELIGRIARSPQSDFDKADEIIDILQQLVKLVVSLRDAIEASPLNKEH